MFESLFKNAEEVSDKPVSLIADVRWILDNTNYVLLRASWDEFLHILNTDRSYDEDLEHKNLEGMATDSWYALSRLNDTGGDLTKFTIFELHLLKSLQDGYIVYDEIMHTLIDHHDDTREAETLFATHPELHKHVPEEFDNTKQIMEVLLESTRIFRLELEQFSQKHSDKINTAIKIIIEQHLKSL